MVVVGIEVEVGVWVVVIVKQRKVNMNDQLSSALVDVIKAGKDGVMNVALFALWMILLFHK